MDELDREAVEKALSVLDKEIDLSRKKTTATHKKTTATCKKTTPTRKKTTASPPQTQAQAQEAQASLAPPQKRHGRLPTFRRVTPPLCPQHPPPSSPDAPPVLSEANLPDPMEQYRDIVPAIADAMQVQSVILNTIAVCVQEYAVRLKDQQKALLEYQQKQEQKEKQRDQALEQWKQQLEGKQGRQEQSLRDQIRQQEQHIQRIESERNMAWDYNNRLMIHLAQHKILPPAPTLESSGPILATVTPSNTPYIDRPVAPPEAGSLTLPHMFPLEPSSATELPPIPISRVPGTSATAALAVARSAKFTEFYAYEADGNRNLHKRKQQKGPKEAKEPKKSKKAQKATSKPEHTERLQQLQGDK